MPQSKARVYVSFDFDNDKILKEFIVGQAKLSDSPFEISDCSLKEAAPEPQWEVRAAQRISTADVVIVMVGAQTWRAPGVLKEVAIARRLGKPIYQVIGYRNGQYRAVPNAGRLYAWNWENLKRLFGLA